MFSLRSASAGSGGGRRALRVCPPPKYLGSLLRCGGGPERSCAGFRAQRQSISLNFDDISGVRFTLTQQLSKRWIAPSSFVSIIRLIVYSRRFYHITRIEPGGCIDETSLSLDPRRILLFESACGLTARVGHCSTLTRKQLPQHIRQYPAVVVVINLDRRVDAQRHRRLFGFSVRPVNHKRQILARRDFFLEPG